ncbi:MAG: hypothetical protein ACT4QF_03030 [Sporichthyaceae bacterium]
MRLKLITGLAVAALAGTRAGRDQIGRLVGLVKQRVGGAAEPTDPATGGPPSVAEEVFTAEHPTPGTVAAAVGAPNAPDPDVIETSAHP